MDRKNYPVPLGWYLYDRPEGSVIVSLSSRTLVLPAGGWRESGVVGYEFDVERVSGSPSPHVPEKKPRYRVTWDDRDDRTEEVEPVRLSTLSPRDSILVPLETRRSQTCIENGKCLHGIYSNHDNSPKAYCGKQFPFYSLGHVPYVVKEMPTCPECLINKMVWHLFTIHPFVRKADVVKAKVKDEKKRLKLPTAYHRILDDGFLTDAPTYKKAAKAVIERPPLPEVEPEDELVDPRERKRESAIDRNRRFESSKATVKGHRR